MNKLLAALVMCAVSGGTRVGAQAVNPVSRAIAIAKTGRLGVRGTDKKRAVIGAILSSMTPRQLEILVESVKLPRDSLFGDLQGELVNRARDCLDHWEWHSYDCFDLYGDSWERYQEARWRAAFVSAQAILRSAWRKAGFATPDSGLPDFKVDFFRNPNDWATGYAGFNNRISINLAPSVLPGTRLSWMKWEDGRVDGFSKIEMVYVALHETGHIYHFQHRGAVDSLYMKIRIHREGRPTLYAIGMCIPEYNEYPDDGACVEDWAEIFALEFLDPLYLKRYYPYRYQLGRSILGHVPVRGQGLIGALRTRLSKR